MSRFSPPSAAAPAVSTRVRPLPSPLAWSLALSSLLLLASLFALPAAFAQDEPEGDEVEEKVEDVIEERKAEEEGDGKPEDADLGEASYNVEDCTAGEEGEGADGDAVEDCEQIVK